MPSAHQELLAYYAEPGIFTSVKGFEEQVDAIPNDVESMVKAVQGLLIHHALAPLYRVELTRERVADKELHASAVILGRAAAIDPRPISHTRPPQDRVGGVCRHFATLFVAFARHKGIPARVRCGFAGYFQPGWYLEHWVGEYWNAAERRWVLVDAQVDDAQRRFHRIDIDTLDVPRDRFLVAGDSWRACRDGADASRFGVAGTENFGMIETFGELWLDISNLQKVELLPWNWYGLPKQTEEQKATLEAEQALIDRLAALDSVANAPAIEQLRALIAEDSRLQLPAESLTAFVVEDQAALARHR